MPDTIRRSELPLIAIVGRANVGKSTLWNKLTEQRRAIVSNTPHTTRDRSTDLGIWRGKQFQVTDTGGIDTEDDEIGRGIRLQVDYAIKESALIFFVIDAKTGVLPEDEQFAKELRKTKKPVILVANKVDNQKDISFLSESGVYRLGYGDPIAISAATGKSTGDLLDLAYDKLEELGHPASDKELAKEEGPTPLHIVFMGRTNVGKSSLVNAILGEERVIVANIEHTTREPQDTVLHYKDRQIVLIDTAGMRRRSKLKGRLDTEALERNKEALKRADVAFLVLDTNEEPTSQDKELAGLMKEEHKGLVIIGNKWDIVPDKTTRSAKEYETKLRYIFPFLNWAPIMFVSAKTKKRTDDLLDAAIKIQDERNRTIDYNAINRLLKSVIKQKRPLQILGPKSPYIHDIAQVDIEPPKFLVTIRGQKNTVHASWLRFLERRIREKFGFEGTPIIVQATNVPMSKSERAWNVQGPGMDAVPYSDEDEMDDDAGMDEDMEGDDTDVDVGADEDSREAS